MLRVLKRGKFVRGVMANLKVLHRADPPAGGGVEMEGGVGNGGLGSVSEFSTRSNKNDDTRVAVVVSTKVFKRAVDRNRAKRLVRESMRLLLKAGKIKAGYDLVFLVQSGIAGTKQQEVQRGVEAVLLKAGLLN